MDLSEETAKRIATLQAKLNKKLGPEYISQRPGPGGGPKLTYAEGWKIINLANEVFGFNGWSSSVVTLAVDYIDLNEETKRFSVGVSAIVRITLRDGAYHEDVGYGLLENSKSKGAALDKCKKEAVTDAVKRALRNFGNLLGNCLYDKSYAQEVIKIKVPPPKFDKSELHRRPEFDEKHMNADTPSKPSTSAVKLEHSSRLNDIMNATTNPAPQAQVLSAVPPHIRTVSDPTASTPSAKGKAPMGAGQTGLNTPVRTPDVTHGTRFSAGQRAAPQRHQNAGAQPPPTDRKVSFAPPPAACTSVPPDVAAPTAGPSRPSVAQPPEEVDIPDDESFHFNSEDDAFLAEVDLGEDGIGGPIDFDEGAGASDLSTGSRNEDAQSHPQHQQQHMPPPEAPLPQPQARPQRSNFNAQNTVSRLQSSTSNGNQSATTKNASVGSSGSSSTTSGYGGSRAPTPSLGGFNFPPGVSPRSNGAPTAPARHSGQGSGSGIGLKRNADAMQGQPNPASRRSVQGMGLAPHSGGGWSGQGGQGGQRREPLAALELGGGGDIKRVKR